MAATQGSCTNNKYSLWLCPSAGSVGHARLTAEMASLAQLGNASFPPHISVATNLEGTEAEIVEKTRIVVKAIKETPTVIMFRAGFFPGVAWLECALDGTAQLIVHTGNVVFGQDYTLMPHLSLVYVHRALSEEEKEMHIAQIEERLPCVGSRSRTSEDKVEQATFEFGTLELWETPKSPGKDPALGTWKRVASFNIPEAGAESAAQVSE